MNDIGNVVEGLIGSSVYRILECDKWEFKSKPATSEVVMGKLGNHIDELIATAATLTCLEQI
jgi:hypothetical protein